MGKWPLMHYIVTFSIISMKPLSRTMRNTDLSVPHYTFVMLRCPQKAVQSGSLPLGKKSRGEQKGVRPAE